MALFKEAIKPVLKNEGGYSDIPEDRGGPTNFGITLKTFQQYAEGRGHTLPTKESLRAIDEKTVFAIYKTLYWDKLKLDQVHAQDKANVIFDAAVNHGITTATRLAQKTVWTAPDGVMGPITLNAINSMKTKYFIRYFAIKVINRYISIAQANPDQLIFLRGWINRAISYITLYS